MATIKKLSSGTFQICVRHRLLPKTLWATFDTKAQAESYAHQLEALLGQGIVPSMLLERTTPSREIWTVTRCIVEYQRHNALALSEVKLLDTIQPQLAKVSTGYLNYEWAESWIRSMKRDANLSPSTIRHRQGALARCFYWMVRRHPEIMVQNPLRLLKRGFSTYTPDDVAFLARQGRGPKFAEERDRRLGIEEEMRIREVLADRPVELTFFILALETAMRMRECYTLDLTQINLDQRTIYLDRSNNGDRRQVPLSSTAIRALADHMTNDRAAIKERSGRLFPYWSGAREEKELDVVTRDLSRVFALVFEAAGAPTLHFHDLRHEATCRLYEKTSLTDVLIARITGHRDLRQLKRYASLRGSDLAPSGAGLQGPARRGDGVARRRSAGNCPGIGAHVARVSGPIDCPGNAERRPGTGGWRQRSRRVLAGAAGKGAGLQRRAAVLACRAIVRAADAPPVEPPAGMGALRRRAHRRGEAVGFAGRCPARSLIQETIYLISASPRAVAIGAGTTWATLASPPTLPPMRSSP